MLLSCHCRTLFRGVRVKLLRVVFALLVLVTGIAVQAQSFEIRMRAFIPNVHPTNPGYVRPTPTPPEDDASCSWPCGMSDTMIPGPGVPYFANGAPLGLVGPCFNTNDRDFDSGDWADSKLLTTATFNFDGSTVKDFDAENQVGKTYRVDCATGVGTCEKQATAPQDTAMPAVLGKTININVAAAASNPCAPTPDFITPAIKWSGLFAIDTVAKTIRFTGTITNFPAFEAYVVVDGQPPITMFQEPPAPGSTAWSLLTTRSIDVSKPYKTAEKPKPPTATPAPTPKPTAAPPTINGSWQGTGSRAGRTWTFSSNGRWAETSSAGTWGGNWSAGGSSFNINLDNGTHIYGTFDAHQITAHEEAGTHVYVR